MRRTMGDTWWTEIRWRISIQLLIWAAKVAPAGDARGALVESHIDWITECNRQWHRRYRKRESQRPYPFNDEPLI